MNATVKRINELQMLSFIISQKKINALTPRLYYWPGIGHPQKANEINKNHPPEVPPQKKFYLRKITAMGETHILSAFEFVLVDMVDETGMIKNKFNNTAIKVLQCGKYTDLLKFTEEETESQFEV